LEAYLWGEKRVYGRSLYPTGYGAEFYGKTAGVYGQDSDGGAYGYLGVSDSLWYIRSRKYGWWSGAYGEAKTLALTGTTFSRDRGKIGLR